MTLPPNLASMVSEVGVEPEWGSYAHGADTCSGAAFHSPTPLVLNWEWITPEPAPDHPRPEELQALLCPTCAANLNVLQGLLVASDGQLPWPVRREFGNKLRGLAMTGWQYHRKNAHV